VPAVQRLAWELTRDNRIIGRFRLDGIPHARRGVPQIKVFFDIDANGILNMTAKDTGTGREQTVIIEESTNLDQTEVDQISGIQRFGRGDGFQRFLRDPFWWTLRRFVPGPGRRRGILYPSAGRRGPHCDPANYTGGSLSGHDQTHTLTVESPFFI
jgi:hypothetical protein